MLVTSIKNHKGNHSVNIKLNFSEQKLLKWPTRVDSIISIVAGSTTTFLTTVTAIFFV